MRVATRPVFFNTSRTSTLSKWQDRNTDNRLLLKAKRAAKKFMAYRQAKRDADQSVDTFFARGDGTSRFAYFND